MSSLSVTTTSHPEWDRKIAAGLHKKCEALTGIENNLTPYTFYVKSNNTFVGGMHFNHFGDILWLDSMWVEPSFRKQGVGKLLLQEAHLSAIKNKAKEIQLNTFFQDAHVFFLRCGFEDVAMIPHWKYGLACYLMRKIL